jgi:2-aminoadipate transaminase
MLRQGDCFVANCAPRNDEHNIKLDLRRRKRMDYSKLFSTAAVDRVGTMGERRWGQGGMLAPIKYSFEGGMPDPSTYPMEAIAEYTKKVCMTDRMALNYGSIMGFDGMREVVVELENQWGGHLVKRENVLITSGASQALRLVYETLLNPGDTVLLEEESYIAQQIKIAKPNVVTVPMDNKGPVIAEMRKTLESLKEKGITPKLFYIVTGIHNPMGITTIAERSKAVLALAREFGFMILEDDPYSRIRFTGQGEPSMYSLDETGQYVIRVGTVSKILGAGLRIGWAIASPKLLQAFQQFKQDGGTNPFAQRVAAAFMKDNMWSHIKVVTASYLNKRNTMLQALDENCKDLATWNVPDGGIFLRVETHKDVDDDKLLEYSQQEGVGYRPGKAFASNGKGGKNQLRLAYSFQDPETITEGIKRLGVAMHKAAD